MCERIISVIICVAVGYVGVNARSSADNATYHYTEEPDSVETLREVVVKSDGTRKMKYTAGNTELITAAELTRAACCNLGESFTTNPSVDVNYTDAATGARQIRLLGLAGRYVQMLTENVPNFRGAASPFGLGYMPGPWMQSISVSKGASSVKNGPESISGQINIEMRKPQAEPSLSVNGYLDHRLKGELNFTGNMHFGNKWSGGLLLHGENSFKGHDDNGDGFVDMPKIRQFSAMNRWAYLSSNYVFQLALKYLDENRRSGQDPHHIKADMDKDPLYKINIDTKRGEVFTKNAYIFDKDNDGNVALILSGSWHHQNSRYGVRFYDVDQANAYASLMFERKWKEGKHALSAGLSYNYDHYRQHFFLNRNYENVRANESDLAAGGYAQYTLDLDSKLILMAGLRLDFRNYGMRDKGWTFTPRLHVRYNPDDDWSFHASGGLGSRTVMPIAEMNYLLASSRDIISNSSDSYDFLHIGMEEAWNYGVGASWTPSFLDKKYTLSVEYYLTRFLKSFTADFDTDPHEILYYWTDSKFSNNSVQVELTARVLPELTLTGAYRYSDSKSFYGKKGIQQNPLISRSKGLFTVSWTPQMGLWQTDVSLAINSGGRMPNPYQLDDLSWSWNDKFKTYCTLNAQVTRNFRHWAVYIGGENLTGFTQKNPIIGASNPWGNTFDSTMIWGPLHGAVVYVGFRYNFTKY